MEEAGAGTRRRATGYVLGALAVVGLVVVGGVLGRTDRPTGPAPPPSLDATLPTATLAPSITAAPGTPVTVTEAGPLISAPAGWELFAQGPGVLARLELASGRITRTVVPEIDSGGPLSVIAGPDRVLIRPGDAVAGYAVRDGRPAETLTAPTLRSGLLVAGPGPSLPWAESDDPLTPTYVLLDMDGRPTGSSITLPPPGRYAMSDGGGSLLISDTGGTYQATPAGLRRVTTGIVLAAGPTAWLVVDCDDSNACTRAVVDRGSRARRPLPGSTDPSYEIGVITQDGALAAFLAFDPAGAEAVHLVDLTSGTDRTVPIAIGDGAAATARDKLLWAPDNRSLFLISDGKPVVVDARTGRSRVLWPALPPMTALAFRANS